MTWLLTCPVCRRTYTVPARAPWACPASTDHEPIRVEAAR